MTTMKPSSRHETGVFGYGRYGKRMAVSSTVLGALALAAVGYAALLTYVIDPPNWIRVVGLSLLPIGWAGAVITGVSARNGPGRAWALTGLALAALTAVALTVLVATGG